MAKLAQKKQRTIGLSSLDGAFRAERLQDGLKSLKSKEQELEKRLDEIGDALGDGLEDLRNSRKLWKPEIDARTSFAMVTSLVMGSEEYIEADVADALIEEGREEIFKKTRALRLLVKEQDAVKQKLEALEIEMADEQKRIEAASAPRLTVEEVKQAAARKNTARTEGRKRVRVETRTPQKTPAESPVTLVDPLEEDIAALDELSVGLAALRTDDSAWAAKPNGELPSLDDRAELLHRCVLEEKGCTEQEIAGAFSPSGKVDFLRTMPDLRALYTKSQALKLQLSPELILAASEVIKPTEARKTALVAYSAGKDARDHDRAQARGMTRLAERLALATASDAPPVPPPDVENDAPLPGLETAEALPDMELVDELCDEIEAALKSGHIDDVYEKFDTSLLILELERARLEHMEKAGLDKDKRIKLGSRLANAFNRRESLRARVQDLLRRTRPALKEKHGEPTKGVMPVLETAPAIEASTQMRQKLVTVRNEMLAARKMLGKDNVDVRRLNDILSDADARINEVFVALDERKKQGHEERVFEASVHFTYSDLRRLQEKAENAIALLKPVELSPDAVTLDREPELEESEPVFIDDEDTQERPIPTFYTESELEDAKTFDSLPDDQLLPKTGFARIGQTLSNTWKHILHGWRQVEEDQLQATGEVKKPAGNVRLLEKRPIFTQESSKVTRPAASHPSFARKIPQAAVSAVEQDGAVFRGHTPEGSRVLADGVGTPEFQADIMHVLMRVIEKNPKLYGLDDSEDMVPVMSKRMAYQLANEQGLSRFSLTNKAADRLNLFPEKDQFGKWQIIAVVGGKRMSMEELAKLGFMEQRIGSK